MLNTEIGTTPIQCSRRGETVNSLFAELKPRNPSSFLINRKQTAKPSKSSQTADQSRVSHGSAELAADRYHVDSDRERTSIRIYDLEVERSVPSNQHHIRHTALIAY